MRLLVGLVLVVLGVLAVVVAVLYFTQPAHALPGFLPGHLAHAAGKHTKRGVAALVVGVVLLIAGGAVAVTGNRGGSATARN